MDLGTIGAVTGTPVVATSNHGGHSPDVIAELCTNRLISVAQTAHPAIREQADAYREYMLMTVREYIKLAVREDRETVAVHLTRAGYPELAAQLKGL